MIIYAKIDKTGGKRPLSTRTNETGKLEYCFGLNLWRSSIPRAWAAFRISQDMMTNTEQYQVRAAAEAAVMHGPAGWVLNMGGRHGMPAVAEPHRIISVRKRRSTAK
jgi:hypothetical protein